jgi:hypothetical protein
MMMYSEIHMHRVLYKSGPNPGNRYLNIVIVEKEQFEVRVFEGEVEQLDPKFVANSSDAAMTFHHTLQSANEDANKEFAESVTAGWLPYTGHR